MGDHTQNRDFKESVKVHHLVRIQEKIDTRNGSLIMVNAILKGTHTNSTYYDFRYLYMDKNRTALCLPRGFKINFNVTVNVIVVAKRQTKWVTTFSRQYGEDIRKRRKIRISTLSSLNMDMMMKSLWKNTKGKHFIP